MSNAVAERATASSSAASGVTGSERGRLSRVACGHTGLAPDLVKAAIEGRLPHGIGIARLCDAPAEWPGQYRKLALPNP
jgi:hypothetical protein